MSDYNAEDYESFDLSEDAELDADDPDLEDDDTDDDDDTDEDLDDDEDDDLEDAGEEDIDLVVGFYREDGEIIVTALSNEAANDLEVLIAQLRRLPGEAGVAGFVSLAQDVFCAIRVRGRKVQVMLSDAAAANDWPIARDVADYLDLPDTDDDDDDPLAVGDLGLFADMGLSDMDLQSIAEEDEDSDQLVFQIADRIRIGRPFRKVVDANFN